MTEDSFSAGSGGANPPAEVRLREAPARFFADSWSTLVFLKKGEGQALAALGQRNTGHLVYMGIQAIQSGAMSSEREQKARDEQKAYNLIQGLFADLQRFAADGRLIGSGLFAGTGKRQDIPSELWADAEIEFTKDRVASGKFEYRSMRVREPETPPAQSDPIERIHEWLEERRHQRVAEKKLELLGAAREAFGDTCTVRAFNAVYRSVYGRKRGRPQKMKK